MRFHNPENFKQGELLLSRYTLSELMILITSIILSVVLIVIVGMTVTSIGPVWLALLFILSLVPGSAALILLNPLNGYHNAYYFFKFKLGFRNTQKKFMWEGIQYGNDED